MLKGIQLMMVTSLQNLPLTLSLDVLFLAGVPLRTAKFLPVCMPELSHSHPVPTYRARDPIKENMKGASASLQYILRCTLSHHLLAAASRPVLGRVVN